VSKGPPSVPAVPLRARPMAASIPRLALDSSNEQLLSSPAASCVGAASKHSVLGCLGAYSSCRSAILLFFLFLLPFGRALVRANASLGGPFSVGLENPAVVSVPPGRRYELQAHFAGRRSLREQAGELYSTALICQ